MIVSASQIEPTTLETTLEAVVNRYFENFNREDYTAVAALFSDSGVLLPPFEDAVLGPTAIARYLSREATGMKAIPLESQTESLATGDRQIVVKGRVKTPLFSVNVQWIFVLNAENTLQSAEIKLLASLKELLQFNQG